MHATYNLSKSLWRALGLALTLWVFALPASQRTHAQFAYSYGKAGFDSGVGIGVDTTRNVYATGYFNGQIDFDPGPDALTIEAKKTDVYVVSFDSTGALRFAFPIGNSFPTSESSGGIAVEESGRFYIAGGQPFGSIDFDPDPLGFAETSGLVFLASYEGDGDFRWAVPITGDNVSSGEALSVSLDAAGNVYLAGSFVFFLDFDPQDTNRGALSSSGSVEAFFASYTASGDFRFAYRIGGQGADYARDIVSDNNGNVYVTGAFTGTAAFDPDDLNGDTDVVERTAVGTDDIFLASYTPDGDVRFVYTFGGSDLADDDTGYGLSVDAQGNVYLVGEGGGLLAFDPLDADQDGDFGERAGAPNGSAFLASYTSAGVLRFANVFQGGASTAVDVDTDDAGTSYITGDLAGEVDFDARNGEVIFPNAGGTDVFVASYDTDGAYRKAFTLTGSGLLIGRGVAFEPDEDVLVTGGFAVMMDLGRDATVDERLSAGQNDAFIARYEAIEAEAVDTERPTETPRVAGVAAPYPNPFTAATEFDLFLPESQTVSVRVFDILGRSVASLHEGTTPAGTHRMRWDAANAAPGLYLIRAEGDALSETRQVVLLR